MTISTKLIRLDDEAKTTYYDILRNGCVVGSAFRQKAGWNFENENGCTHCKTMRDVKDLAHNLPRQFTERLVAQGIPTCNANGRIKEDEKQRKNILEAIEAHRFSDFEYFDGEKPHWSMDSIREDMNVNQFAGNTESWADFLHVNGITYFLEDA